MRDRIFYSICFGLILGVLMRSFILVNFELTLLFGVISFALLLFFTFISSNKWALITSVLILATCLGILRFNLADKPLPEVFEKEVGNKVALIGEIVDEPDKRETNQKLTVETKIGEEKTKILLSSNLGTQVAYGDQISFSGKLQKPENFITDTGKEFDYVNYLRKDGILYIIAYPKIEVISSGNGNKIKSILFAAKNKFLEKINFVIPEPESLLMGGLILGEKSAFSQELRQQFVDTGTIHIIALSGYNITIVAEWFMKLFAFLPHVFGIWMGMLAIILFVIMTGANSTALRAGIMATLALIARMTGRTYDIGRALILAGVVMIIFNPYVLAFDVSFQLSFIATVAVIYLSPKIEKYFLWVTKRFGLRDILSVTTAAYIFVLPFIVYKMGNLSMVAMPANILILPLIPLTMLLGFATGFIGLISYFLSIPFGYLSYLLLHYELGVISMLANFSFASIAIPNFPLIVTVFIYAYFVYRLFGRNIRLFFIEPGESSPQSLPN